ncbi:ATP-binding protein, partial [Paenibacillus sp. HJGM_3]|uniref:ATP-binding protein n=1 Tax=Paenibacillus sp. HJGM_3 TaxID=3379816 RepID=UPI00385F858C
MSDLREYKLVETVGQFHRFSLYRALYAKNGQTVLLKVHGGQAEDQQQDVSRLLREYQIRGQLNHPRISSCLGIETVGESAALVLQEAKGIPLCLLQSGPSMPLHGILTIGHQIASALEAIHNRKLVHRSVRPDTMIVDPETYALQMIDLSCAEPIEAQSPEARWNARKMERSHFAFLSPELAGWLQHIVDVRSDLYAAGVLLYWLLTGEYPYDAEHQDEWFHALLTREPTEIRAYRPDAPEPITRIVRRLLAQNPDDRYQTAYGLKMDLRTCLQLWIKTGSIPDVPLGEHDRKRMFRIPDRLYGREREKAQMLQHVEWVRLGASRILFITGTGGIGKTTLVREVCREAAGDHFFQVEGRFDRLQQEVPYAAVIAAFRELVRLVYTRDNGRLPQWKTRLLAELGSNSSLLCEAVPELRWLIGDPPQVKAHPSHELQHRFRHVVRQFIRTVVDFRPILLYLDDLHWADPASLSLLASLFTDPESQGLLLIGSYRDIEVGAEHPLLTFIREAERSGMAAVHIPLEPLPPSAIHRLLAETLHCSEQEAETLGRTLRLKTAGNPLYIRQLLRSLADEEWLVFDESREIWHWGSQVLDQLPFAEDIAAFMEQRLAKLPDPCRRVMAVAAVLGERFDIRDLARVEGAGSDETLELLSPARREGMIVPIAHTETTLPPAADTLYGFLHDRIRSAAYDGMSEPARQAAHWQAGQLLLKRSDEDQSFFAAVHHLNLGKPASVKDEDRIALIRWNAEAGGRAKKTAAFQSALQYYSSGLELVRVDDWSHSPAVVYALYAGQAECLTLCGRFPEAEPIFDLLFRRASSPLDQLSVYRMRMMHAFLQDRYAEATRFGVKGLRDFGIQLSASPRMAGVLFGSLAINVRLKRTLASLTGRPKAEEPEFVAAMDVLSMACTAAALSDRKMYAYLIYHFMRVSIERGNTDYAPVAFSSYALMQGMIFKQYRTAHLLGNTAVQLAENLGDDSVRGRTYSIYGSSLLVWGLPARECRPILEKA